MNKKAEGYRNATLICLGGIEKCIKTAKDVDDFIDLIRRTGMLAERMACCVKALAESNEKLKPLDDDEVKWIRR